MNFQTHVSRNMRTPDEIAQERSKVAMFSLTFTHGMPPPLSGPNIYLLHDGSIAIGELAWEDNKQWLKSFNPAGMTPMDIAANKIIGWAPAGPRRGVFD